MPNHPVEKSRRQYNSWVANESLEDYALRYSPSSFRKWSSLLIANTALGGISFLALEAIGAVLLLSFGFSTAAWAIALASLIILLAGIPISYYSARYNIDIDLLTRSAGFGYVGSTITSLIYASFCFIFFALEAAIMAQALKLYFGLPLFIGYILCSVIIIPIVFYGVTAINRLHKWTQPLWLVLMLVPFYFVLTREPQAFEFLTQFQGTVSGSNSFDWYYFGIATGISFSLIAQIGEQVDYLRFMPNKHKGNQISWWISLLAAGPGWIILGFLKQMGGLLLAAVAVLGGLAIADAKEPVEMYYIAYQYVFDNPSIALAVTTLFVVVSQIKINVTNAYAGSLAWSNFFSRVTHSHPGRVVWLVFNIGIALLLMELGVFEAIQKVLGLYSNVAIAWIAAVVADLAINKPLGLSPPIVEFKRAHLHDYNPVGFVSMIVASVLSIIAFTGVFGLYAQAYSWLIALVVSFALVPVIAIWTKGKYYIARDNVHFTESDELCTCGVCDLQYAQTDFAYCPYHETNICSLCCTLDASCKDQCKPQKISFYRNLMADILAFIYRRKVSSQTVFRAAQFLLISGLMLGLVAIIFWLSYTLTSSTVDPVLAAENAALFYQLYSVLSVFIVIAAWWIVLVQESQALSELELNEQNKELRAEVAERQRAEGKLRYSEQHEQFHSHALEMIASETSLPSILETLVRGVEQLESKMLPSILLLDKEGSHLLSGAAPSLPDFYNAAIHGIEIGVGVGSCGTAAFTGKRVIVEDISTHEYWAPYKELAADAGLGSCWSQPILSTTGKILGTFAIYHHEAHAPNDVDISIIEKAAHLASIAIERSQAEEEILLQSEMMSRMNEGVYLIRMDGTIVYANPEFEKMFGYDPDEMIGQHTSIINFPKKETPEGISKEIIEGLDKDGTWQGEVHNIKKDGTPFWSYASVATFNHSSYGKVMVTAHTDITARKKAEEALQASESQFRQAQKMEAVGTLVGGIAHDFNNTLAGITGNLYLAKKDAVDSPAILKRLNSIEDLSFHAAGTIKQLLGFSRKDLMEKNPIVVSSFLKETLKMLKITIPENIRLKQSIEHSEMQVVGDINQLQQVFVNLLNNARDAVKYEDDPEIKLSLKYFEADRVFKENNPGVKGDVFAAISVTDNGHGIHKDHIQHLFEPFFTTKEVGEGTGLGLAMVYGAAKAHGATITIDSTLGEGSTFTLYLPLESHNENLIHSTSTEDEAIRGQGEYILLVDDDEHVLSVGKDVIEEMGYQVLVASDGIEAVEIFTANHTNISLVVTDVVMPNMGGIEAVERMRLIAPEAKVIFSTGYARETALPEGTLSNGAIMLSKPYRVELLSQAIQSQLNS
ncbi:MAG: ATP-binding protein [Mariprofundaceae bacterium]